MNAEPTDARISAALEVAGLVYGGVSQDSPQWRTCLDVVDMLQRGLVVSTDAGRYAKAREAFEAEKVFNVTNPVNTEGSLDVGNGQRQWVRVDSPAKVFPNELLGEVVMAWFLPAGWQDVRKFRAEAKPITVADELTMVGQSAKQQNKFEMAEELFLAALHANPLSWKTLNEYGALLANHLNRHQEAYDLYSRGIAIEPTCGPLYHNRALSLRALGRPQEAVADFRKALILMPSNSEIRLFAAETMKECGLNDEADALIKVHTASFPKDVMGLHVQALQNLSDGNFAEGWPQFESRLKKPFVNAHYEHFPVPRWNGENLEGKRVLVWGEQGVGDEILTASMIPDAIKAGANVTLLCDPRLETLFKRSFPEVTVDLRPSIDLSEVFLSEPLRPELLPQSVRGHRFDFQMSQADLGRVFRPSFEAFPKRQGFLEADENKEIAIRGALPPARFVGIAWHSAKNIIEGKSKSIPLDDLGPVLMTPGITFVNLQYGKCEDEIAEIEKEYGVEIINFPQVDQLTDMDTYASLVAAMDLVITVANTTVHVAGALNIPTWVMVPEGPGRLWFYFRTREDLPWYPSARLFRQPAAGQWQPVIDRVAGELARWVKE